MKKGIVIFILLLIGGCEIIEEDISQTEVQPISPTNGASVMCGRISFKWEGARHVIGYEFRLVEPSFSYIERILIDTIIYADTISHSYGYEILLSEGQYEWSVTGFNHNYKTQTSRNILTVLSLNRGIGE